MKKRQRLDKILSNMGCGSRKNIKRVIREGRVQVNDKVIRDNKVKVHPYNDRIAIDNVEIYYREYIYLMLNKPKEVVSSTEDPINRTVLDLIDEEYLIFSPFPVGRLDKDTEGLLILTNDGKLAHEVLSPKKAIDKTYYAEVDGSIGEIHIEQFKDGVMLDDGYRTLPARLEILESNIFSRASLTIREGKFHQVKRMFEAIDMNVVYLKRVGMGSLILDENLEPGEYRELTGEEVALLRENKERL